MKGLLRTVLHRGLVGDLLGQAVAPQLIARFHGAGLHHVKEDRSVPSLKARVHLLPPGNEPVFALIRDDHFPVRGLPNGHPAQVKLSNVKVLLRDRIDHMNRLCRFAGTEIAAGGQKVKVPDAFAAVMACRVEADGRESPPINIPVINGDVKFQEAADRDIDRVAGTCHADLQAHAVAAVAGSRDLPVSQVPGKKAGLYDVLCFFRHGKQERLYGGPGHPVGGKAGCFFKLPDSAFRHLAENAVRRPGGTAVFIEGRLKGRNPISPVSPAERPLGVKAFALLVAAHLAGVHPRSG